MRIRRVSGPSMDMHHLQVFCDKTATFMKHYMWVAYPERMMLLNWSKVVLRWLIKNEHSVVICSVMGGEEWKNRSLELEDKLLVYWSTGSDEVHAELLSWVSSDMYVRAKKMSLLRNAMQEILIPLLPARKWSFGVKQEETSMWGCYPHVVCIVAASLEVGLCLM